MGWAHGSKKAEADEKEMKTPSCKIEAGLPTAATTWRRLFKVNDINSLAHTKYIRNQLQEDITSDQMTLKEYIDPFMGDKNTKA